MPTKAELKKDAKKLGFISNMEGLGFKLGPTGFWFYRERGEFIDVIDFWMKSSMKWVEVPVICFIKDKVKHCDMAKFPKGFTTGMPCLSRMFAGRLGFEISGVPWKVADSETIKYTFNQLLELIKEEVDPWFKALDSKEKIMQCNSW
ncbi:hypothetical protein [uncultured Amphritea sp.]|mgnify:CR=1 FL=1|uniref:hypothetical protein n=1 Tax=uncultured Amphritea sp. TaxID=981605 RepID=UPI0025EDB966|nr:hypothetical protein [uncultured Amphritea sp.]